MNLVMQKRNRLVSMVLLVSLLFSAFLSACGGSIDVNIIPPDGGGDGGGGDGGGEGVFLNNQTLFIILLVMILFVAMIAILR